MLVCACRNAGTSKCFRCVYSNLHLGDVPSMPGSDIIKAAYIKGASDYGGCIVHAKDTDIKDLLQEIT